MTRKKSVALLHFILILGIFFLSLLSFYILPSIGESIKYYNPEYTFAYYPGLVWAWSFVAPIFLAVLPLWKIFSSLGVKGGAFCYQNVKNIRMISNLSLLDAFIFPLGMLVLGFMGASQPALTYIITPSVIFVCVSVAVILRVLAKLVEEAVKMKEENELTI